MKGEKQRYEGVGAEVWERDGEFTAKLLACWPFFWVALVVSSLFIVAGVSLLCVLLLSLPKAWSAGGKDLQGLGVGLLFMLCWTGGVAFWQFVAVRSTLPKYVIVDKLSRCVTFKKFLSLKTFTLEEIGEVFLDARWGSRGWWAGLVFRTVGGKTVFRETLIGYGPDEYGETIEECRPFVERVARAVGKEPHYAPETK